MKVAIIHDWLVTNAGAERVLEAMLDCFPTVDLFTTVDFLPREQRGGIKNKWRSDAKRKGLERAGSFNWRRCAEETAAVYREVIS